jgi:rhodanese-related sulfurtransferase
MTHSVSLDTLKRELDGGAAVVIDVREPREHANGVIAGAKLLPLSQVAHRLDEIPRNAGTPVYLICHTQNRSSALLGFLLQRGGYHHVKFVEGGMSEWSRRGWPLVAPAG